MFRFRREPQVSRMQPFHLHLQRGLVAAVVDDVICRGKARLPLELSCHDGGNRLAREPAAPDRRG